MTDRQLDYEEIPDDEVDALTSTPSQCLSCIHRDSENPLKCKAFPDGIPIIIFGNGFDHRYPFPGDGGITWFPKNPNSIHPLPYEDS